MGVRHGVRRGSFSPLSPFLLGIFLPPWLLGTKDGRDRFLFVLVLPFSSSISRERRVGRPCGTEARTVSVTPFFPSPLPPSPRVLSFSSPPSPHGKTGRARRYSSLFSSLFFFGCYFSSYSRLLDGFRGSREGNRGQEGVRRTSFLPFPPSLPSPPPRGHREKRGLNHAEERPRSLPLLFPSLYCFFSV